MVIIEACLPQTGYFLSFCSVFKIVDPHKHHHCLALLCHLHYSLPLCLYMVIIEACL